MEQMGQKYYICTAICKVPSFHHPKITEALADSDGVLHNSDGFLLE